MEIQKLNLSNFAQEKIIKRQEYSYGAINGAAEMIGYQIIFFKDLQNPSETSVISIEEDVIYNKILLKIGDSILDTIGLPFRLKGNQIEITEHFGDPIFIDDILENIELCYYYIAKKMLLRVGIHKKDGICSVEIIANRHVIKERLEYIGHI